MMLRNFSHSNVIMYHHSIGVVAYVGRSVLLQEKLAKCTKRTPRILLVSDEYPEWVETTSRLFSPVTVQWLRCIFQMSHPPHPDMPRWCSYRKLWLKTTITSPWDRAPAHSSAWATLPCFFGLRALHVPSKEEQQLNCPYSGPYSTLLFSRDSRHLRTLFKLVHDWTTEFGLTRSASVEPIHSNPVRSRWIRLKVVLDHWSGFPAQAISSASLVSQSLAITVWTA
jgi:hypothetical protein